MSRIWETSGGKYTNTNKYKHKNTLAKIQVSAIFHMRDIWKSDLPICIEQCMGTPCWCPSGWATT